MIVYLSFYPRGQSVTFRVAILRIVVLIAVDMTTDNESLYLPNSQLVTGP